MLSLDVSVFKYHLTEKLLITLSDFPINIIYVCNVQKRNRIRVNVSFFWMIFRNGAKLKKQWYLLFFPLCPSIVLVFIVFIFGLFVSLCVSVYRMIIDAICVQNVSYSMQLSFMLTIQCNALTWRAQMRFLPEIK